MGYSARYHAASLAAVFLALAVGILIGVGFGSDIVNGTADDLEESLHSDLDQARAQVDDLQGELDAERDFGQTVYPAVVNGQLRGQRIALVALGGLDEPTAGAVDEAIGPAGGKLAEVAVVRLPPDLDAIASTRSGRAARALARGDEDALRAFAEHAGRSLEGGGPDFDELRGTVLTRYSGKPGRIDAVVVVHQRTGELDADEAAANGTLEDGLISGLTEGATVVGVETSDADPSSISFFDGRGLSTVDSVNLVSGRVALVFALGGASGDFGIKETADSLLPDLLSGQGRERSKQG